MECTPYVSYTQDDMHTAADLLREFCSCSGEHLREMAWYVTVFASDEELREIPENDEYFFCAKGIDLESKILNGSFHDKNGEKILEFADLYRQKYAEEPVFEHLHEGRHFDYCAYHRQKKEGLHCALDDAMYLAKKYTLKEARSGEDSAVEAQE